MNRVVKNRMAGDREAQFKELVREFPDSPMGHFSLGRWYLDEKRFGESVPCFREAVRLGVKTNKRGRPGSKRSKRRMAEEMQASRLIWNNAFQPSTNFEVGHRSTV